MFSSLWISGLAMILAAVGFADYQASISAGRLREMIRRPGHRAAINVGLMLFCLGLLGTSRTAWESVAWGLLATGFLALALSTGRAPDQSRKG